jgi:hypothetical protein
MVRSATTIKSGNITTELKFVLNRLQAHSLTIYIVNVACHINCRNWGLCLFSKCFSGIVLSPLFYDTGWPEYYHGWVKHVASLIWLNNMNIKEVVLIGNKCMIEVTQNIMLLMYYTRRHPVSKPSWKHGRLHLKCDGTHANTRFRLLAKTDGSI